MTHIDTDNPFVIWEFWFKDFLWQNWYWFLIALIALGIWSLIDNK